MIWCELVNGAEGIRDIEGKAATGSGEASEFQNRVWQSSRLTVHDVVDLFLFVVKVPILHPAECRFVPL